MVNRIKFEDFQLRVLEKFGNNFSFLESDYLAIRKPLTIKCNKHNIRISLKHADHLTKHNPCKQCVRDEKFDHYRKKVLSSLRENYPQFKLVDKEIRDFNSSVKIRCQEHGVIEANTDSLVFNRFGCAKCGRQKTAQKLLNSQRVTFQEIKRRFEERFGDRLVLVSTETEYKNFKSELTAQCVDPNHPPVNKTAFNFLRSNGCKSCKESFGERLTRLALEKLKIEYVQEKRFASCRDRKELPFDFWLPKFSTLIEFQGKQHNQTCKRFGGKKSLQGTQRRDAIKLSWAKQNGIKLIYVTDYRNIKKFIVQNLKSSTDYDVGKVLNEIEASDAKWIQDKWSRYLRRLTNKHKGKYDFSTSKWTWGQKNINYICKIHGEKSGDLQNLLKGHGCGQCAGNDVTLDEVIERSRTKFGNNFDFSQSKFGGIKIKMDVECSTHGIISLTPEHHLRLENGCQRCSRKADDFSPEKFLRNAHLKFGERFDYSELNYRDALTKVTITCVEHNYKFLTAPHDHLKSATGCCKHCVAQSRSSTHSKPIVVEGVKYKSFKDAAEHYGLSVGIVRARLKRNWNIDTSFRTPKISR